MIGFGGGQEQGGDDTGTFCTGSWVCLATVADMHGWCVEVVDTFGGGPELDLTMVEGGQWCFAVAEFCEGVDMVGQGPGHSHSGIER